jgi:hypothetical protein
MMSTTFASNQSQFSALFPNIASQSLSQARRSHCGSEDWEYQDDDGVRHGVAQSILKKGCSEMLHAFPKTT